MRQLLIFLLILFGIWWVRRALQKPRGGTGPGAASGDAQHRRGEDAEPMIACAHCGIHVPESEGVRSGERFYCCEDHRRLGPGR